VPLGDRQCRLVGQHSGILRLDLVDAAHRPLGLRQRCSGSVKLGLCRMVVGAALIDHLRRRKPCAQQHGIAVEIRAGACHRRLDVSEIGFRLRDLGRLAGGFEICKLHLRLGKLAVRLVTGCEFLRFVLLEQRRAFGNGIAAPDMECGQETSFDRADIDIVSFGITLPGRRRFALMTIPPQPPQGGGEEQNDGNHEAHVRYQFPQQFRYDIVSYLNFVNDRDQ
jgi:hypothetical protein